MHETPIKGGVIVGFYEVPVKEPKPVEAAAPEEADKTPAKKPAPKKTKK